MATPVAIPVASARRTTWIILCVAFIARMLVLWDTIATHPRDWLYSHGIEMGLLANSLIHGQGYSSPFGVPTGPTAFIAPGYPTIIAGVFLIFGVYSFASAIAIMLLQLGVCLVTVWLMMHISREILDERTAKLAGSFWAISFPLLWMPTIFWETSLSACALPGMIALALRCRQRPTMAMWALMGACCAVLGLINPALLPSFVAIMGWTAWQTRRVARWTPLLGVLTLLAVFAPWPIRNAQHFHAFIPLRSTVGFELWMGNRPGGTGYLDVALFPTFDKQELANYISEGEVAYTRGKSQAAWTYIRAHPGTFVVLSARRCLRYWTGTGTLDGSPVWAAHSVLTAGLGFWGLALLFRSSRRSFAVLMALPLLLFPLPYYITHAEFKYRLNIDPLLTMLAAYAAVRLAGGEVGQADGEEDAASEPACRCA